VDQRLLPLRIMLIQLDADQATILEEVLESARKELRIESARADSHDFREELHAREDRIDEVLAQLHAVRNSYTWSPRPVH
jgi:hypothetical protein